MSDVDFGSRLREAREKKKLTQGEAAAKAGIAKAQTLSAYERGVNSPPLEVLKKLAEIYQVSTDFLLFGSEVEERRIKSDKEYFLQFIAAADYLQLPIVEEPCEVSPDGFTPLDPDYLIKVCPPSLFVAKSDWPQFSNFLFKWKQLRYARNIGAISDSDYSYLIDKLAYSIPDDVVFTTDKRLPD